MARLRPALAVCGAAVCLILASCSGSPGLDGRPPEELAWPAGSPRVRLSRLVESERGRAVTRWVRAIAGSRRRALFERPFAAAWDGVDLVITDPGARRVVRIDERGHLTALSGPLFDSPIGVAICDAGVVVSDSRTGAVVLLDRHLALKHRLAEDLAQPTGITCDGSLVYVAETAAHRLLILELDAAGIVTGRRTIGGRGSGPGEYNFPTVLALAGDSLWVGDTLNFRLQELDADSGDFRREFGRLGDAPGDMPRIKGLAVDDRGHLWISDAHLDQVSIYRPDGTFLMDLGRRGAAAGEFSFPTGVAAGGGQVAVVDSLNRRVQIFRLAEPRTNR